MIFKLLNKLEKCGDLHVLSRAGLLSSKIYMYREVYLDYEKNMRMGMPSMEAVHKTSIEMKVSQALIFRAKKIMES